MGKFEKIPAWQLTKVRNKKEVIDEAFEEWSKFFDCAESKCIQPSRDTQSTWLERFDSSREHGETREPSSLSPCLKEKFRKFASMAADKKSETNQRWSTKQWIRVERFHFAPLPEICHLENAELEPQFQKYEGRIVLRGDIVKDDSGAYAVFTEGARLRHKWRQQR